MKSSKTIIVFIVGLAVGICVGFGGGFAFNHFTVGSGAAEEPSATSTNKTSESAENDDDSGLFASYEWPDDEMNALGVPKPEFSLAPTEVSVSQHTADIKYENITMDEAEKYIEAIKQSDYTVSVIESKGNTTYQYMAQNSEDVMNCTTLDVNYSLDSDGGPSSLSIRVWTMG